MLRLDENASRRLNSGDSLQACGAHGLAGLDQIDDTVRDSQSTSSLHAATDVLDLRLQRCIGLEFPTLLLGLQLPEIRLSKVREACHNVLADQLLGLGDVALRRHLHLQLALAKAQIHNLGDARRGGRRRHALMLGDLVASSDAQVNATLAHEGRDIGSGKEDQGEREVLDKGNVKARVAVELDVGAGKKIEARLVKTPL